jgi:L-lactate dehydrogenase complex protein LldG
MATELPEVPTVPERLPDLEPEDHIALFRSRAIDVDAVVHGPVSSYGVPRAVAGIAAGHGSETFMAWDDLVVAGIPAALAAGGLDRIEANLPAEGRADHQLEYRHADLGVTGADAGLAESGTIVLTHGAGRPRMASLVPEVHIALLQVASIDRSLAHWAHRHPETARDTTNLVLISGPSRTGDIGQHLNLGVHGPRHVHVVLVK